MDKGTDSAYSSRRIPDEKIRERANLLSELRPSHIFTWQVSNASKVQLIADQAEKDKVLRDYISKMTELMLQRQLSSPKNSSEVSVVARALTITTLSQLASQVPFEKSKRKGVVAQLLVEGKLINRNKPKIIVSGADFSWSEISVGSTADMVDLSMANFDSAYIRGSFIMADFHGSSFVNATIYGANLEAAELASARFEKTNLIATRLRGANLAYANLEGARLMRFLPFLSGGYSHVDMRDACLKGANLNGADLRGADLRGANLKDVRWNKHTRWPPSEYLYGAQSIPERIHNIVGMSPSRSRHESNPESSQSESCTADAEKTYKFHLNEQQVL